MWCLYCVLLQTIFLLELCALDIPHCVLLRRFYPLADLLKNLANDTEEIFCKVSPMCAGSCSLTRRALCQLGLIPRKYIHTYKMYNFNALYIALDKTSAKCRNVDERHFDMFRYLHSGKCTQKLGSCRMFMILCCFKPKAS